jgi:hypothetical protein
VSEKDDELESKVDTALIVAGVSLVAAAGAALLTKPGRKLAKQLILNVLGADKEAKKEGDDDRDRRERGGSPDAGDDRGDRKGV